MRVLQICQLTQLSSKPSMASGISDSHFWVREDICQCSNMFHSYLIDIPFVTYEWLKIALFRDIPQFYHHGCWVNHGKSQCLQPKTANVSLGYMKIPKGETFQCDVRKASEDVSNCLPGMVFSMAFPGVVPSVFHGKMIFIDDFPHDQNSYSYSMRLWSIKINMCFLMSCAGQYRNHRFGSLTAWTNKHYQALPWRNNRAWGIDPIQTGCSNNDNLLGSIGNCCPYNHKADRKTVLWCILIDSILAMEFDYSCILSVVYGFWNSFNKGPGWPEGMLLVQLSKALWCRNAMSHESSNAAFLRMKRVLTWVHSDGVCSLKFSAAQMCQVVQEENRQSNQARDRGYFSTLCRVGTF